MWLALAAVVAGLALLVWSADRFVDGASATANHAGMPPLLIGMLIIGFGTSAPEMVVSALAAGQGNPGLALGNAFGSNITNIALIIGLVAVISPIKVHSQVVRKELPILLGITLLVGYQLIDGFLSRTDAWILLGAFFLIMGWSIFQGLRGRGDSLSQDFEEEVATHAMPLGKAIFWLLLGLVLLIVSSRILVWGAVYIAESMGVSDLIIGLTVVAIGTSLPELASSLAAIRRNEHDLALGNVIGSGLFNTLAVVGIAAGISPLAVDPLVLQRDWVVMFALTLLLLIMGFGSRGKGGEVTRVNGVLLLLAYIGYTGYLVSTILT
ncbi:calcium/sodium antiporter [Pseudomonas neustonica]|uniref:Calcium/sodium antiporter n=1 Tax=Pseudomonas neustonica TaxID=2487346 RepID=A0ABX9XI85_9PSED|nr:MULTISPECIES: calcium/sodium antiporter [Pseudomonas]MAB24664.1 calcium/sodium antiporter [Pseudomonadales bacterium]ROZ83021.1 calcium/sodium antiporter [Pseudomonas sp. SSM44]ROZ84881.1 calcium/sodium antiporter [Pseudomonas neustonica]